MAADLRFLTSEDVESDRSFVSSKPKQFKWTGRNLQESKDQPPNQGRKHKGLNNLESYNNPELEGNSNPISSKIN